MVESVGPGEANSCGATLGSGFLLKELLWRLNAAALRGHFRPRERSCSGWPGCDAALKEEEVLRGLQRAPWVLVPSIITGIEVKVLAPFLGSGEPWGWEQDRSPRFSAGHSGESHASTHSHGFITPALPAPQSSWKTQMVLGQEGLKVMGPSHTRGWLSNAPHAGAHAFSPWPPPSLFSPFSLP